MSQILEAAGTSKGGFYNHFKSKEELFFQVLDEARNIWREKNLSGLDEIENPIEKIKRFLENFRDLYLKKHLLKRLLDEAKASGGLSYDVDTRAITEMLFAGMLGATVMYGVDKSDANLDRSINTLIDYLETMKLLKEVN